MSLAIALALAAPVAAAAQEIAVNERHKLSGPRVGVSVVSGIPGDRLRSEFGGVDPFMTEFGWLSEQFVTPGTGRINFVFREMVLIGGIEQGKFFPSLITSVGIRQQPGLELGVGPSLSPLGVGLSATVGWNFLVGTTAVPVNVVFSRNGDATRLMLITGFGIETMRRAGAAVR
jgi:hypothetical protein